MIPFKCMRNLPERKMVCFDFVGFRLAFCNIYRKPVGVSVGSVILNYDQDTTFRCCL